MIDMEEAIRVQARRFCTVSNRMLHVPESEVGVVCGLLVISDLLVSGCLLIVVSRTLMMVGCATVSQLTTCGHMTLLRPTFTAVIVGITGFIRPLSSQI
jgi:hypothetical protein